MRRRNGVSTDNFESLHARIPRHTCKLCSWWVIRSLTCGRRCSSVYAHVAILSPDKVGGGRTAQVCIEAALLECSLKAPVITGTPPFALAPARQSQALPHTGNWIVGRAGRRARLSAKSDHRLPPPTQRSGKHACAFDPRAAGPITAPRRCPQPGVSAWRQALLGAGIRFRVGLGNGSHSWPRAAPGCCGGARTRGSNAHARLHEAADATGPAPTLSQPGRAFKGLAIPWPQRGGIC